MSIVTIKPNPTRTDLVVFALLWLAFFGVLAAASLREVHPPYGLAAFAAACWLASMAFNREEPLRRQAWGVLIPAALVGLGLARVSMDARLVASVLVAIGLLGCAGTLASSTLGAALYQRWMLAVAPIGWTVAHVVLAVVYFLVFTPLGLALRLLGRDPMCRRIDRGAPTYWIPRRPAADSGRYLRQW